MQDLAYSRVQPKSVLTFCIRRAKGRRDIGAIRGPFDLKILSAFTLVGSFLAVQQRYLVSMNFFKVERMAHRCNLD